MFRFRIDENYFIPVYETEKAIAPMLKAGMMTSSPFLIPIETSARCKAEVPDEHVIVFLVPCHFENSSSNSTMFLPLPEIHPDETAALTRNISLVN